nr:uncharacterized protein LOC126524515 [Dermacentor andersoni]
MSLYAIVIPYLGSTGRVLMVLQNCITAPFVSLSMLGLAFPCVDTKAAVIAATIGCIWQCGYTVVNMMYGAGPPRMAASLDGCDAEEFAVSLTHSNVSTPYAQVRNEAAVVMISTYWNNLLCTTVTIFIGLLLSIITDGHKQYKKNLHLTSAWFLEKWVIHGFIPRSEIIELSEVKEEALLQHGAEKYSDIQEGNM